MYLVFSLDRLKLERANAICSVISELVSAVGEEEPSMLQKMHPAVSSMPSLLGHPRPALIGSFKTLHPYVLLRYSPKNRYGFPGPGRLEGFVEFGIGKMGIFKILLVLVFIRIKIY